MLHYIFITFYYILDCVSEYIPFVSKKDITNTQTQTKKQKKLRRKETYKRNQRNERKGEKKCCCCEQYL